MKITASRTSQGITDVNAAFNAFSSSLRPSLKLWDYFVNWDKVFKNTSELEIHLNVWNYLLGKDNFEERFLELLTKHPEIVAAIPVLIVRDGASTQRFSIIQDLSNLKAAEKEYDFSVPADTPESRMLALEFVQKTGLQKIFQQDRVKNLVDYVLGVEAGLDSNGRKNRSGNSMEYVVERYLEKFCSKNGLRYISQASPAKIETEFGFVVPVDRSSRIYDFAVTNRTKLVIMEVNFYGGGGSKLKATAGEYKGLHDLLKAPDRDFVWITDGQGWKTTLHPLREAYEKMDYIWNLNELADDYLLDLFN